MSRPTRSQRALSRIVHAVNGLFNGDLVDRYSTWRHAKAAIPGSRSRCACPEPSRRAHFCEPLESRTLLAAVNWTGLAGDNLWTTPGNWSSTPSLPGPADDVTISVAANPTITLSSGTQTINSLISDENLTLSGGTLSVAATSVMNGSLSLFGGTLAGAGDFTLNDATNTWTGGTMSGSGKTIIANTATLSVAGPAVKSLSRRVENKGIVTWNEGDIEVTGATFLNNGTFNASATGAQFNHFRAVSGAVTFTNNGTLNRIGSPTAFTGSQFDGAGGSLNFDNAGLIEVTYGGGLLLDATGNHTGTFVVNSTNAPIGMGIGTGLAFVGDHVLSSSSTITGVGALPYVDMYAGTRTFSGAISGLNVLWVANGTNTFAQATVARQFRLDSGSAIFDAPATFGPGTDTMSGGTLAGSADVTFSGALHWTGGTMSGSGKTIIASGGTVNVSGAGNKQADRPLDNNGTVNHTEGILSLFGGGTHSGSFVVTNVGVGFNTQLRVSGTHSFGPASSVTGTGTLESYGGTTTLAGVLNIGALAAHGGTLTCNAPATITEALYMVSGSIVLNQPTTVGNFGGTWTGGNLTANADLSVGGTNFFSGGLLSGSGDVTFTGTLDWTGGTMNGSGKTIIASGATLQLGVITIGRTIDNFGTINWTSDSLIHSGVTITNHGLFRALNAVANPLTISNGTFENLGTFEKASGTADLTVLSLFNNDGTMQLDSPSASTFCTVTMQSPGSHSGTFDMFRCSLLFGGVAPPTFTASAEIVGDASNVQFGLGPIVFPGSIDIDGAVRTFSNAAVSITGPLRATILEAINTSVLILSGPVDISTGTRIRVWNTAQLDYGSSNVSFGQADLQGGTLMGAGELTLTGSSTWSGGTISDGGKIIIPTGAMLDVGGGTKTLSRDLDLGGTLTGTSDLVVDDFFSLPVVTWTGGTISGTGRLVIELFSTLLISGNSPKNLQRTLRIVGQADWRGGDLVFSNGRVDNVGFFFASALVPGTLTAFGQSGTNAFDNGGDFVKDDVGTVSFQHNGAPLPFNNAGLVNPGVGTGDVLELHSGGVHTNDFLLNNATLTLRGTHSFAAMSDITGAGSVEVLSGSAQFGGMLNFAGALRVTGGTATFAGAINVTAIEIQAAATLQAGGNLVLRTESVSVSAGGTLDLADNALIVDYSVAEGSPLSEIKGYLTSGYAAGAWNGVGINSSTAASTPNRALGYAESSAIFSSFPAIFATQQVDDTAVLVRYTRYGDADLSGNVNLNDFNRLAASFGQSNTLWSQGNFNFDNITNLNDFNLLAANFGASAAPDGSQGGDTRSQLQSPRQSAVAFVPDRSNGISDSPSDELDQMLEQQVTHMGR